MIMMAIATCLSSRGQMMSLMLVLLVPVLIGASASASAGNSADVLMDHDIKDVVVKRIVNTVPWWPPSNLKFEEAVGVVSRGVMFATGMMENTTDPTGAPFDTHQLTLELLDVHDIVFAANTSLANLVDCVANVPLGGSDAALAALVKALGGIGKAPSLTVIESQGEDPMYNSSISCYAAVNPDNDTKSDPIRGRYHSSAAVGEHDHLNTTVVVQHDGMVWFASSSAGSTSTDGTTSPATAPSFWAAISHALDSATTDAVRASDIVDCTVFVPLNTQESTTMKIQQAIKVATTTTGVTVASQTTIVKIGLGSSYNVKLRCTALVGGGKGKRLFQAPSATSTNVVVAGGFAYVSGVGSAHRNATDAFKEISQGLSAAGSRMNLVINCLFWVTSEDVIDPFFGGFQQAFNVEAFPPPSRTEFVGVSPLSQCIGDGDQRCPVLSKCVAAMPA
eukprot:m.8732 g.8732  ORF g.8732 m.8732 type:complete len:449 (-) comp7107_c0_seq1:43-1389(-)